MKVLFLGANLVGVKCIQTMMAHPGIDIVGVLPRNSDTGEISDVAAWNYSVRRYSNQVGLDVSRKESVNSDKFFEWTSSRNPDYIISVQYDKILNCRIIELPKVGCLNLHFSLLPSGRGCNPIPWAIIDDRPVGATLHRINRGIDTGSIIGQVKTDCSFSDTAYTAYMKTVDNAAKLFVQNLDMIASGNIKSQDQPGGERGYRSTGTPHNGVIDWSWPGVKIDRFIRALTFNGFKSAVTHKDGNEIQIKHPIAFSSGKFGVKKKIGEVLLAGKDFFEVNVRDGKVIANFCSIAKPFNLYLKQGDVLE